MTPEEKQELKNAIVRLISATEADIADLEGMTQPISPENSIGRVSRMDAINNKSVMDASKRNKKAKLAKLKVALNKIDEEDFGICVICERPIQPKRLMFMPESSKCVRCAAR